MTRPVTTADLWAAMTSEHTDAIREANQALNNAVLDLRNLGIVTTIETVPRLPLAMGNYSLKVNLRPDRGLTQFLTERAQEKIDADALFIAAAPLTSCAAHQDGDCYHAQCPQIRDCEPAATGRHCPLDVDRSA